MFVLCWLPQVVTVYVFKNRYGYLYPFIEWVFVHDTTTYTYIDLDSEDCIF